MNVNFWFHPVSQTLQRWLDRTPSNWDPRRLRRREGSPWRFACMQGPTILGWLDWKPDTDSSLTPKDSFILHIHIDLIFEYNMNSVNEFSQKDNHMKGKLLWPATFEFHGFLPAMLRFFTLGNLFYYSMKYATTVHLEVHCWQRTFQRTPPRNPGPELDSGGFIWNEEMLFSTHRLDVCIC